MEPFSLLVAAGAFLAAEAAKRVGDLVVERAFDSIKEIFQKQFGRDPEPDDFTVAEESRLREQPAFVEQARALWTILRTTAG
jgi:hypothetical protein